MTREEPAKFFQSERFRQFYFLLFLVLLIFGLYTIVRPEPFLKYGYFGVFLFNLLGGPGTYLIPSLSQKMSLVPLALSTAIGMTFNDSMGWVVGQASTAVFKKGDWTVRAEQILKKYGVWGLFILSVLPIPYDAIGLAIGYLGASYKIFFWPTLFGKFVRFILIGLGTSWLIAAF
ncbi:VTT domain-containing protein [Candidatus Microgenomates bacterium]|nr:VTT domain-containing protein [Candidatus Microgenomates bacterium]